MSDEIFIKKYEELLDKGYCNCNEMNCIDNNTPRRILNVVKNLQQENQQLKEKIKTYEDPEDLTLMFMYCDEKAKDKIQELEKQNINLREDIMLKKIAIPYEEINDKSLYDLYTIPSYSDLSKENQELKKQLKIKHNGFMASVDESCDLAEEIQKYKDVIDKAIKYINEYRDYQDVHKQVGIDRYEDVTEDILFEENIEELLDILKEVE